MARTFGGVSTNSVVTGLTTHATLRTYSIWARRTGAGGGSLGSMFRKRTVGAADILQLYNSDALNWYEFDHTWSGGGGQWSVSPAARPALNTWSHICVTYDGSSTTNLPQIYYDGIGQSMGTVAAPVSGAPNTNTDPFVIGNRTNDNARVWAGDLGEFAVWDTILSTAEITEIVNGNSMTPLHIQRPSLVAYYEMGRSLSPEPDLTAQNAPATVTGTTFADNPNPLADPPQPNTKPPLIYMRPRSTR